MPPAKKSHGDTSDVKLHTKHPVMFTLKLVHQVW